ncbi:helix-turn-helix domain-containing protein [Loigolactobacillus binensis]|uniref:Helix-turn-helix domain-containing protein n=1 Tax=Loigolactobacillus binensis TaxID=2559922 RepID=A0ABW3EEG8_9LACO|nr:helix-turn-helix domain-containing protein [Loigolactobacillus binensis]
MSLGHSLSAARLAKQLTQAAVAKKLYVTRQTVSRWEQNKTIPNIYVLKDLSSLYELSIDELLAETKQATQQKEGTTNMKHINFLALFGVIFFNMTLFSGGAITAVALLLALWVIIVAFILSPVIAFLVYLLNLQQLAIIQVILSLFLFVIGITLLPLAQKITFSLYEFFVRYIKYNQKTIYN